MTQIRETGGNGGIPAMPPACPKINALNPPPRGLRVDIKKSIFSRAPRLSTSRLPLPHGSPRRSAKNALLYVTRTLPHSRASHHTQRLNRLSFTEFVFVQGAAALSEDSSHARSGK